MIRLTDIHRYYPVRHGKVEILKGIDLTVEKGDKVGIIGGNGAGKSTLIRLISGIERPDSGTVERDMRISWPLAFSGAFQGSLTGLDNVRFICRIYDVEIDSVLDFVADFAQLGRYLREPIKVYSSGMRARLAFALSMMIEFDCYLIDEIVAVGDSRFQERCHEELFVKRSDRAMIIVSHDPYYLRHHCDQAKVLAGGRLRHFDDVDTALTFHHESLAGHHI